MKSNYKESYEVMHSKITLWVKRIYVVAFNIYAWYWLYRQIFVRNSYDFEEYLLWFFTTAGMYYFVLDSKDLFLTKKDK